MSSEEERKQESEKLRAYLTYRRDLEALEKTLLENLATRKEEISKMWDSVNSEWGYEDPVYRFYHQSFKVFRMQEDTVEIVTLLQSLCPEGRTNEWFTQIYKEGTGKTFTHDANRTWVQTTRPIVEAFFHARYFLDMANRYAGISKVQMLPSGWAGLLYFYDLR